MWKENSVSVRGTMEPSTGIQKFPNKKWDGGREIIHV